MTVEERHLSWRDRIELAQRQALAVEAHHASEGTLRTALAPPAEAPEAPPAAPPTAPPKASPEIVRSVGFDGTIIETNVALDAPPPRAWNYRPKVTRRASSLPRR